MRFFSLLAALAATCLWPTGAHADDLVDAIQSALDTHPRLHQERANLRAAREAIPLALAPYRPQVSIQGSTARSDREAELSDGRIINDETRPSSFTINASQTLYTSGRRNIAARRSLLEVRSAQARYSSAEQDIIIDVATAYLDLLLADETLIIETNVLRTLEEQTEAARIQLQRGVATRTDLAQAEARLAEARARFATSQANLAVTQASFERATGYRAINLDWHEIELPWSDLQTVIQTALDANTDLAASRYQAEMARLDVMAAARRNGPTISIGAQRSESENISPAVIADDETQVNLTFSMPLLTGGESSAQRRRSIAARSSARFAVQDVEAEVILQATQIWAQLEAAGYALEAQQERIEAATLALEGVERGREAGLWTFVDVLDATEQVLRARLSLAQAQRDQRLGRVRLALMTGVLEY